jgi:superfamily II DNA helicase RecQ
LHLDCSNAINVGIDDKKVVLVLRFDIPCDLPTLLQERGRASCDGRHATFILLSTINAYINLVRGIYSGHNSREEESEEQTSTTGAGLDITPLANRAAAAAAVNVTSDNAPTQSTKKKKKKNKYALGTFQKRKLLSR